MINLKQIFRVNLKISGYKCFGNPFYLGVKKGAKQLFQYIKRMCINEK